MACPTGSRASAIQSSRNSFSPAATRTIHSTRSTPHTASVTGCSTWSRALTSRKAGSNVSASTRNSTVPADRYDTDSARLRAVSANRRRVSSGRPKAGDSSTTFWLRRCMEQSRSPSVTTPPTPLPNTCTSTWRARSMNFSTNTPEEPKLASANRRTRSKASRSSSASRHTDMPMPPPPATAFNITGNPMEAATARASSAEPSSPLPASRGTPAAVAASRARCLAPKIRSCSGVGPMKAIPTDSSAVARSSFSDRNPYPGCTASAPWSSAADTSLSTDR